MLFSVGIVKLMNLRQCVITGQPFGHGAARLTAFTCLKTCVLPAVGQTTVQLAVERRRVLCEVGTALFVPVIYK